MSVVSVRASGAEVFIDPTEYEIDYSSYDSNGIGTYTINIITEVGSITYEVSVVDYIKEYIVSGKKTAFICGEEFDANVLGVTEKNGDRHRKHTGS